ncbi:MAG: hypothetical protein AAGL17_00485 [Cyanobacteria bacterium J06576_12]
MLPDFHGLRHQASNSSDFRSLEHSSDNCFSLSQSSQQLLQNCDRTLDHRFFELWTTLPSWSPILKKPDGWITIINPSGRKVPLVPGSLESCYRRDHIIGKRFGKLTNYLMIDIDTGSPFHPNNGGIQPILAAMESLGLCRFLLIRSSVSGGLHIYFPLAEPVSAWGLACAAHAALTAAGIAVAAGICELFPNKKSFNAEFNGHRLPLQVGSFLLDNDFSPITDSKAAFFYCWQTAAAHQDEEALQLALFSGQLSTSPVSEDALAASMALGTDDLPAAPPFSPPRALRKPRTVEGHVIPPIAWTSYGQSNDIMRELVNYGDRYVGLKTIDDLAAWVKAIAPQLPGYQEFASPRSKRDIERGTWPQRWSKSHFDGRWYYNISGPDHNAKVARDAKARIFAALERVCVEVGIGATALHKTISRVAKSCFNLGVNWRTFKKHEAEVREHIKHTGVVSLPSGGVEDINFSFSELPITEVVEPEREPKICHLQLVTHRCAVGIYSKALALLHRGQIEEQVEAEMADELPATEVASIAISGASDEAVEEKPTEVPQRIDSGQKLTVGQRVRITMPGGSLNGVEAQVVGQVLDTLGQLVYQLDYQRQGRAVTLPVECLQVIAVEEPSPPQEGVIRATAAQLLNVLGKACPFVGPGLWTVRREEVSPIAWRQLRRLVGEA